MNKLGPGLWLAAITVCSGLGALVITVSIFGRSSPLSASKEWILLLTLVWILLFAWALLFSWLVRRLRPTSWRRGLRWAALCHAPLAVCLPLVYALYSNDSVYHAYAIGAHGQVIFEPLSKAYVILAPAITQALAIAIWRWRTAIRLLPIVAITLTALILRFWNLNWGLPALTHPDEYHYTGRALVMFSTGDLNPHFFENPSLLIYIDYFLDRLLAQQVPAFHVVADFFQWNILDPRGDYLRIVAARFVSVLAGTLTVPALYFAAKELVGRRAATVAAAVLAVSFLHVRDSHYATNDILATFLLTASFAFSARIYSKGNLPDYLLAALLGGLATSTKYNAGFFWLAILVAHLARLVHDGQPVRALRPHLVLAVAAAISLLGFLIGTPYATLDFASFKYDFGVQSGYGSRPWTGQEILPPWIAYSHSVVQGFGLLPLAMAAFGILLAVKRDRWMLATVMAIPAVYLLFMSTQRLYFVRFDLPALPFLALMAGYATHRLLELADTRTSQGIVFAALLLALIAQSLVLSIRHDQLIGEDDTRALAASWIVDHTSDNALIGSDGYNFVHSPFQWKAREMRNTSVLDPIKDSDAAEVLDGRFQYVIVGSFGYGIWYKDGVKSPNIPHFYDDVERVGRLVAEFRPSQSATDYPNSLDETYTPFWHLFDRDRPGPTIKIYDTRSLNKP